MTHTLDIAEEKTWPNKWLANTVPRDIEEPVELYQELDHPGTDHALACELRDGAMQRIDESYTGCTAYHCCRPLRPESYREHGLWVTSEDRLFPVPSSEAGGSSPPSRFALWMAG